MKVKIKQDFKPAIINVPTHFARIVGVRRNDDKSNIVTYEVTYDIDQVNAVKGDAALVEIIVRKTPKVSVKSVTNINNATTISPLNIVDAVILANTSTKDAILNDVSTHVTKTKTKVKLDIDTNTVNALKNATDDVVITKLLKKKKAVIAKTFNVGDNDAPVLKVAKIAPNAIDGGVNDVASKKNIQAASLDVVMNLGVDPSELHGANVVTTTAQSLAGVLPKKPIKHVKAQLIEKKMAPFKAIVEKSTTVTSTSTIATQVVAPIVQDVHVRQVRVVKTFDVDLDASGSIDALYVEFRVIDTNGKLIASLERTIQHATLMAIFETPRIPPRVNAAPAQLPGRNVIEVIQDDERAVAVRLYRRKINSLINVNDPNAVAYESAGEVPVSAADGPVKIVDVVNNTNTIIYRVIPVGPGGRVGSSFTNVVVTGTRQGTRRRRRQVMHAAITAIPEGNTVVINVTNIVKGPIAVGLQRRDVSIFERNFRFVTTSPIILTDNDEDLRFVDDDVRDGHVYEYRLLFYYEDGSSELSSASSFYEHVAFDTKGVDISISDPQIRRTLSRARQGNNIVAGRRGPTFDVVFSIETNIAKLDDDMLHDVLRQAGLSELYSDELKKNREKLSQVIAHRVQRINMSTGELEDFGTIVDPIFSDAREGLSKAVKPVVAGMRYKYLVTTLLRAPESMFSKFEKVVESKTRITSTASTPTSLTTKQYKFSPSKNLHPITLKTGTLTTEQTRKLLHGRDEFAYGIVGNTRAIEVVVPHEELRIVDVNIARLDVRTNIINWGVVGDVSMIDYFIVIFHHLGTDEVIGKIHALNDATSFRFLHDISGVDVGTATYTIRAMLTNFDAGPFAVSNEVVI